VLTGPASLTPAEAVEEMRQKLDDYNGIVSRAMTRTYWKFAFTIGGAALSTTAAVLTGNPLPAVGALWSVVQFAKLDRSPVVQAGDSAPAAMFHDIQQHLG